MKLILGEYVKDEVTQFEGTVTAICRYLDETEQGLVQPVCTEDNSLPAAAWFDQKRLHPQSRPAKNGVGFRGKS